MRYGICTGLNNLDILERTGYDYIELSVTATMQLGGAEREEGRQRLASSKVKCEAFNILFPKTMDLIGGGTGRQELEDYLRRAMELIAGFGAEIAVFGSGRCRRCPEGMRYGEAYRRLTEVFCLTGETAERYGITVVIEPLSRSETNMICTMAEGAILEADVNHPRVKLLSDYFHVMQNHDEIRDIETIRDFGHIHIASSHGRRYPLSEEGEEYAAFLGALKKSGYDGRVSIEGKTEDMEADARAALAFLKGLEGRNLG